MPTYEYKREDGSTFEIHQKMSDEPLTECPDTGQKCKRVISGGMGTHFVGPNWADKKARKARQKINPYGSTLPEYRKKIKKNTERALEQKEKNT